MTSAHGSDSSRPKARDTGSHDVHFKKDLILSQGSIHAWKGSQSQGNLSLNRMEQKKFALLLTGCTLHIVAATT